MTSLQEYRGVCLLCHPLANETTFAVDPHFEL